MKQEWRRLARCASFDPEAPYATEGTPEERAFIRLACGECPVVAECLRWALQFDDPGVLGGLNQTQRRAVKKRPGAATGRCGTDAGYFRHRRRGEKACDSCRSARTAASAEATRERKRASRARAAGVVLRPPEDTGACGTSKGYQRHHARSQGPCEPCRQARLAANRDYKAHRKVG